MAYSDIVHGSVLHILSQWMCVGVCVFDDIHYRN